MSASASASASASTDLEWLKFMSKMNDEGDDDDEVDPDGGGGGGGCHGGGDGHDKTLLNNHNHNHNHNHNNNHPKNAVSNDFVGVSGGVMPVSKKSGGISGPKRTCISKKQQRRTYSFIDSFEPLVESTEPQPQPHPPAVESQEAPEHDANYISPPNSTPIYISTKTKISYLNRKVDIYNIFWDIPVVHYYTRSEAVIKKQIKFHTTNPADVENIKEKLKLQERYYEEQIIEHINNPTGRIVFKDQRKISIGLCKKDLLNDNIKKKRAFFNCFVLILRINGGKCIDPAIKSPHDDILFKEMHVKVFNTGKLEIPGIQDDRTLIQVLDLLVSVLRPIIGDDLDYLHDRCETVLINSNFSCGFYINRDRLFNLMKYKYRINSNYDSCSYPGIQCKFYYVPELSVQTGQQPTQLDKQVYYEISFMIFRTGSILIVGKCSEPILNEIYQFIKKILETEFQYIQTGLVENVDTDITTNPTQGQALKSKKVSKPRRKIIMVGDIQPFQFVQPN